MPATASYTSQNVDNQVLFRIEPARGSVAAAGMLIPLGIICMFSGMGAMSGGRDGFFGIILIAMALGCLVMTVSLFSGRSTQTVKVDVTGLTFGETTIKREDIAEIHAVDPSAGGADLGGWNSSVMTDGYGRVDRGATMAVGAVSAAVGIGAALGQRQATRNVRIEVRRHGASDRTIVVSHLTGDTALALVADLGRALQGLPVAPQAPLKARKPAPPVYDKVFPETPDGWRGLMAEAERRGWKTKSGMSGVRFIEPKTGREVVASRMAEARQELGF